MIGAKPSDTPMLPGTKLAPEDGEVCADPDRYRRLVGRLNYLTITYPDIAFSVSVVSQFISDPRVSHLEAAMHILRYIKEHLTRGLVYSDYGHQRIEGFSDAD
ncbi:hypothetical protein Dimus_038881 [Dionaea muscipula]